MHWVMQYLWKEMDGQHFWTLLQTNLLSIPSIDAADLLNSSST